jgi:hypothetical protein
MYGLLLLLALVVVVVGLTLLGSSPGWQERIASTARWLVIAAFAVTLVTALAMLPLAFGDEGGPQLVAWLAVPVVATGVALFAPFRERAKVIALWVAAFVVCAFVVVTGLSIGLFFGPAALLAVGAAVTANQARSRSRLA